MKEELFATKTDEIFKLVRFYIGTPAAVLLMVHIALILNEHSGSCIRGVLDNIWIFFFAEY